MDYEEIESKLGNVAVSTEHIEREKSNNPEWDDILENYSADEVLTSLHFSDVNDVDLQKDSSYPNVKLKSNEVWQRIFFEDQEKAGKCFKLVRYRWQAFRQVFE